jgi:pimeloyl-ACP methyl ester carboxylesterase
MRILNLSRAGLKPCVACVVSFACLVSFAVNVSAQQPTSDPAISEFTVLSGGRPIGSAVSAVTRSADGWTIVARESLGPPLDLAASRFEAKYSTDWRPISVVVEGSRSSQPLRLTTTVSGDSVRTTGSSRGLEVNVTHPISPQAVVVPTDLFPAYEALAAQLTSASAGTTFRLYVAPQGEIDAAVTAVTPHRLITPTGPVELREFDLTLANPAAPLGIEVWIDGRGRLARLAIPSSWVVLIRDDISSAMTREEHVSRPGDQEVFIPALGFSLAATMSTPEEGTGAAAAVVLVGAPTGRQDRDELTSGVPVFGHLANTLADAGFVVVRYDKRGVGRSGGRIESATLADYAGDALSVVKWLRNRKDIDKDRVAIVGYGEGAAAALVAASREEDIAAVCLIAPPGQSGMELTFWQQQRALAASHASDAETQEKLALQQRVVHAVLEGGDAWTGIPDDVRQQAETAWFRSWLQFDPADPLKKMKQPILVVGASLDTELPPDQSERLAALTRQRKKLPETASALVIVPGVTHTLTEGTTRAGGASTIISTRVTSPIATWLEGAMPRKRG